MKTNYFTNLTSSLTTDEASVTGVTNQSNACNNRPFAGKIPLHNAESASVTSVTVNSVPQLVTPVTPLLSQGVTSLPCTNNTNSEENEQLKHTLHNAHLCDDRALKKELFYLIELVGKHYRADQAEILEMQHTESVLTDIKQALKGFRLLVAQINAASINQN